MYVRDVNAVDRVTEYTYPNGTTSVVTTLGVLVFETTLVSETAGQGEVALAIVTDPNWAQQVRMGTRPPSFDINIAPC